MLQLLGLSTLFMTAFIGIIYGEVLLIHKIQN
jgi:hypothetical protein